MALKLSVNDKNQPGGEILLSSRTVAKGYYKLEDEFSNASFFTDPEGLRWFRTGDIGQLDQCPDPVLESSLIFVPSKN